MYHQHIGVRHWKIKAFFSPNRKKDPSMKCFCLIRMIFIDHQLHKHIYTRLDQFFFIKVNSVQEACAKCFAVHILKFEILQITWKKWNKEHQTLSFQFFTNKFSILMFFVLFFHVVYKISNFNLAQASCTELTLQQCSLNLISSW